MCKELICRLAVITILITPVNLPAEDNEIFIEKLETALTPGAAITTYLSSGDVCKGRFLYFDSSESALALCKYKFNRLDTFLLPVSEIATVTGDEIDIRRIAPFWASQRPGEENCRLRILNKIRGGNKVSVSYEDRVDCKGWVTFIDSVKEAGEVHFFSYDLRDTVQFGFNDITKISYPEYKIRPKYMALGALGGLIIGMAIASQMGTSGGFANPDFGPLAVAAGSTGGGIVLGTVLPLFIPGHKSIECDSRK